MSARCAMQKIRHDRPGCIGCWACVAIAPEHWKMSEDGKSSVINAEKIIENNETKEELKDIKEGEFDVNLDAAQNCPVNVIHIIKNGKEII